jgi:hypothetical protein
VRETDGPLVRAAVEKLGLKIVNRSSQWDFCCTDDANPPDDFHVVRESARACQAAHPATVRPITGNTNASAAHDGEAPAGHGRR